MEIKSDLSVIRFHNYSLCLIFLDFSKESKYLFLSISGYHGDAAFLLPPLTDHLFPVFIGISSFCPFSSGHIGLFIIP